MSIYVVYISGDVLRKNRTRAMYTIYYVSMSQYSNSTIGRYTDFYLYLKKKYAYEINISYFSSIRACHSKINIYTICIVVLPFMTFMCTTFTFENERL